MRSVRRFSSQLLTKHAEPASRKEEIADRLRTRRAETKRIGERTWMLFWRQIATFALGVMTFAIALAITYHAKLF